VLAFAQDLAAELARRHPDALTAAARKAERGDRLYLDVLRNAYAQTVIAPYTVRARPGAPVATPVEWSEMDQPDLDARRYTMRTIFDRLAEVGDPWSGIGRHRASLVGRSV